MATMWRRAMTYLGLGPDEEYEEYDDLEPAREPINDRARQPARTAMPPRRVAEAEPEPSDVAYVGSVRRLEPQPLEPTPGIGAVTPVGQKRAATPAVRAIPTSMSAKPYVVAPGSFNEAQDVADKYKGNVPVIMNLQNVDRDLSRRLIDFASGLCYGVGGTMEKVAHQVYLLTPSNVEVSTEERRRLQERGLYD
ncbi:MAG TPA: cell division protein SepF [Acidimicrobiales bacterium]|jgi:cell division inhibitor SepF